MTDATELLATAAEAYERAYTPYSAYPVGAAIEAADGTVYTGCNIENANYSNSLHAEEVAVGTAVNDGAREFERLAVASAAADQVTPCGMCRQTLAEFCSEEFLILCGTPEQFQQHTLGALLPDTITRSHLDTGAEDER